ncbi:MAG: hypothetical protein HY922_14660 [Elusimicrobia bacterium]|nr:hypothetical protein [Elusimicrobiota bacterium]
MRTTIELTDEQRGALLELAGRRGLRGYSSLVQEALDRYLGIRPAAAPKGGALAEPRAGDDLLSFLNDGFSSGRPDGSSRHDDYIYRSR